MHIAIDKRSNMAQLFKASLANKLISGKNVNCSSKYSTEFTGIFAEKMWVAFAKPKLLAFFQQKY